MIRRSGRFVGTTASVLVGLVLAHNLIFLVGYGASYGAALARTGHDYGWTNAVQVVLGLGTVVLAAATGQLLRLSRAARLLGPTTNAGPGTGALVARWLRASTWLSPTIALLLVVQENVEHLSSGEPAPGITGVLASPEYPHAVPIIVLVALVVGFVLALFSWRRDVLVARIRASRAAHGAPSTSSRPVLGHWDRRRSSILGRCLAGRAPPSSVAC